MRQDVDEYWVRVARMVPRKVFAQLWRRFDLPDPGCRMKVKRLGIWCNGKANTRLLRSAL